MVIRYNFEGISYVKFSYVGLFFVGISYVEFSYVGILMQGSDVEFN